MEPLRVLGEGEKGNLPLFMTSPWQERDDVAASVTVSWEGSRLHLFFRVMAGEMRARATHTNDRVCEDSCAEVFIGPEKGGPYANIETSATGWTLAAWGPGRKERTFFTAAVIDTLQKEVTVLENRPGRTVWTLREIVDLTPFGVIGKGETLRGKTLWANFTTCGDKLEKPYYLTWAEIDTLTPDFHQPSYFRPLLFV